MNVTINQHSNDKMRWIWIIAFVMIMTISAFICWWYWDRWDIPSNPDRLVLYSIYSMEESGGLDPSAVEKIWNLPVLGKIEITDEHQRNELMVALKAGMGPVITGPIPTAFNGPKHVLSFTSGGKTIVLIIYFADKQVLMLKGANGRYMTTTDAARPLFNKVLKDAGVPLTAPQK